MRRSTPNRPSVVDVLWATPLSMMESYWEVAVVRAFLILIAAFVAATGATGQTGSAKPTPPRIEDFVGHLDFWSAELSPSGRYLAGIRRVDGADFIVTADLEAEKMQLSSVPLGVAIADQLLWASDTHILVSVRHYKDLKTMKMISESEAEALERNNAKNARITSYLAMYSLERATGKTVPMFDPNDRSSAEFKMSAISDLLPDDSEHILIPANVNGKLDLFKLNVLNGTAERVAKGRDLTVAWFVDREGKPAFRIDTNYRGSRIFVHARTPSADTNSGWKRIKTVRVPRSIQFLEPVEFQILSPGPDVTTFYVLARPEGEDKAGIYLYDLATDDYREKIYSHEKVDVTKAYFNPTSRAFQGVSFQTDKLNVSMVDSEMQSHIDSLTQHFGPQINVQPISSSRDGKRWLIKTFGPGDAGSFQIYDLGSAKIRKIANQKTSLFGKQFAETRTINYVARDGTELFAYLTRPQGSGDRADVPLIVMPHGGPEARDVFTFEHRVQMLASQGYQVLQPHFRGSSGFGKAFADKGRLQWGKAMQTDIEDAFNHLTAANLAEPERACIMGFSYGGYAALAAATLTPDLYQCIIAAAAPSDLIEMLKWEREQEGPDSDAFEYWVEHIGHPSKDKAAIIAVSPAHLASRINKPVLLLHGKRDDVVPFEQVEIMQKAMATAGKPVTLIAFENAGHGYTEPDEQEKEYRAVLEFLNAHLPAKKVSE